MNTIQADSRPALHERKKLKTRWKGPQEQKLVDTAAIIRVPFLVIDATFVGACH